MATLSRRLAIVLLGFLAMPGASLFGQVTTQPLPRVSRITNLAEAVRQGVVNLTIDSGRLELTAVHPRTFGVSRNGDVSESLILRMAGPDFAVEYSKTTPDDQFRVKIQGIQRTEVRAKREPKQEGRLPVEFVQPASGPLVLTVGSKDAAQVIRAPSLWHLMVGHPAICREHLAGLLTLIDARWDLGATADEVESILLELARTQDPPDRRRWALLVEQLHDERFARREEADRELRAVGRSVISYLGKLDFTRLDAEQQFRIRRILLSLNDEADTRTPDQIAAWLSGDPQIWLSLLARDSLETRKLAARQLASLLDHPIEFDPAADEAARQSQLSSLQGQLSPK
jgi:hypothetical protein